MENNVGDSRICLSKIDIDIMDKCRNGIDERTGGKITKMVHTKKVDHRRVHSYLSNDISQSISRILCTEMFILEISVSLSHSLIGRA